MHGEALRGVRSVAAVFVAAAVLGATGCAASSSAPPVASGRVLRVVAVEDFWGSIASQVGGSHVQVTSIVTNPDADPHAYEPTAADARLVARADLVIDNGIGYDAWVGRLLGAAGGRRTVLDVGRVVGVATGGNPHRWYNPDDVRKVIAAYTADVVALDPGDAAVLAAQSATYTTVGLHDYDATIADIEARYAGTPVGASESIFSMMAPVLGLEVVTPDSFLRAISEGTDVSAADKEAIDHQISRHLIKVYVYNRQNATPDVQAQLGECKRAGIPTVTITETLTPATATFQAWQTAQLRALEAALRAATGR